MQVLVGLVMVLGLAVAEPEPAAEPQYKSYKTIPAVYEPKKYPVYPKEPVQEYPSYYPAAPAPYYPAKYPEYYPKPSYGQPSKKDFYCDPRSPPKCVSGTNATFCKLIYLLFRLQFVIEMILIRSQGLRLS